MTMNAHGSSMASSTSIESSFSEQDDQYVQGVRQKLRRNRGYYERALSEVITFAFIQVLISLSVLTNNEGTRIRNKPAGQSKSASLIDTILKKNGTAVKLFVDSLKEICPYVYEQLSSRDNELDSTSQESSSYMNSDLIGHHAQLLVERLRNCIEDLLCHIPQFYIHITSVTSSGLGLALLEFPDGLTLLHELVTQDRHDLLKCVQYSGQWSSLIDLHISEENERFAGKTPLDLCVALGKTRCQEAITKISNVERTLDSIAKYVRRGNVRLFREVRNRNPRKVFYRSDDGLTLLDYACQSGQEDMVSEVIKSEKDVRFTRGDVDTAAGICVELGHYSLLKYLADYVGPAFVPNNVLLDNKHLIERAAYNGDLATYKELKRLGANATKSVVSLAASQNCLTFIKGVLQVDPALIRTVEFQDRRKKAAAHFAAEKGFAEVVDFLLELGVGLMQADLRGFTILHYAASNGNVESGRLILEKAEQLNAKVSLLKAKDKYLGSERIFLVRGRDNARPAWHYVEADRAVIDIFRKKTRGGAVDVALYGEVVISGWGTSPSPEVIRGVEDKYDMTRMSTDSPADLQPLHVAILMNRFEFALLLISHMDEVGEPDSFGLTPLHLAAMRGNRQIVEALLAKGASLLAKDKKGRTAEEVARINEYTEIAELLRPQAVNQASGPDPALASLRQQLENLLTALSDENISQHRRETGRQQTNIYLRDKLREGQADINDYLYELGVGPVTSETVDM